MVLRSGAVPGTKTDELGEPGGYPFVAVHKESQPMLGVRWSMGQWQAEKAVARLEPLYDLRERTHARAAPRGALSGVIVARDDYVIGGVHVVSGKLVTAVRFIFVRQNTDGTLDKSDFYLSDWIGDPEGKTHQVLGDGSTPVIGIYGRRGAVINTLGLVLDK
jgi:hypothetical protein